MRLSKGSLFFIKKYKVTTLLLTQNDINGILRVQGGKTMEKIRKVTNLPADLVEEVEKFMKENYITTFTGAVIELIRRGLVSSKGV